jgi:hypothetical protein
MNMVDVEAGMTAPEGSSLHADERKPQDEKHIDDASVDLSKAIPPEPVITEFSTSLARLAKVFHWLQGKKFKHLRGLSAVLDILFKPFFRGTCARLSRKEDEDDEQVYVCVGYLSKNDDLQREITVGIPSPELLFPKLRSAIYKARGSQYWLSLKSLQGFGLYEVCSDDEPPRHHADPSLVPAFPET